MEEALITETDKLLPYFLKHKSVWANYDEVGDVLYLHFKKPNHADRSEMTEDEIIIRYENNEIIGLSVLNAVKDLYIYKIQVLQKKFAIPANPFFVKFEILMKHIKLLA